MLENPNNSSCDDFSHAPSPYRIKLVEYLEPEGFLMLTADNGPIEIVSGRADKPDEIL